ncbi:hypothetical protein PCAR4_570023 [Paraburkholderia caribensis]|nr:hypothetical protein PCAR4_570023 [Paraburkholderia caribensis]
MGTRCPVPRASHVFYFRKGPVTTRATSPEKAGKRVWMPGFEAELWCASDGRRMGRARHTSATGESRRQEATIGWAD